MRNKPLTDIKDENLKGHLKHIHEYALDNEVKSVDSEPTTDTIEHGERQIYNGYIYEYINGTLYKYQLTAV